MLKKSDRISLSLVASLTLTNLLYAKDAVELNTLTVTAQKVEENIQDVPVSMNAFNEDSLNDINAKTLEDISVFTPNLILINNYGDTALPTMRGLRTDVGANVSSVGMYIDGVPTLGAVGFNAVLSDIERIEVLKGPQGTLYGRGTEAGVINIITKKPNNTFKGKIQGAFGFDGKKEYSLNASGPIVENKFFMGIAGNFYEKDGLVKNTYLGGFTDARENRYGKINLRYNPNENLDISFISSLFDINNGGVSYNPIGVTLRENRSDARNSDTTVLQNALKIKYNLDNYSFESITTHKNSKEDILRDFDFSEFVGMHVDATSDNDHFTQEFRINGKKDKLTWLVGINADIGDEYSNSAFISPYYPGGKSETISDYKHKAFGIFSHMEYDLTDKFSILGGIRYDKNTVEYEEKAINLSEKNNFSEVSPKIGLTYSPNENNMMYATISKGYKPGGFYAFASPGAPKAFDSETLLSYEVGSKNIFLDGKLMFNTAIFYMKIDDMQVQVPFTTFGHEYKANAAKAISQGIEFDINYKATENIELFTSFGYTNIEYDEFVTIIGNHTGKKSIYSPEYNYNIGGQYRSDEGIFARVDINGYGDMYYDNDNVNKKDAYNLVNAKLGYETENWDVYLYGKNIFDKNHDSNIYNIVIYSQPREIGVQLNYRF